MKHRGFLAPSKLTEVSMPFILPWFGSSWVGRMAVCIIVTVYGGSYRPHAFVPYNYLGQALCVVNNLPEAQVVKNIT